MFELIIIEENFFPFFLRIIQWLKMTLYFSLSSLVIFNIISIKVDLPKERSMQNIEEKKKIDHPYFKNQAYRIISPIFESALLSSASSE